MSFRDDDSVRQVAEAYSLDAIDFARQHFKVGLDWSDASIQKLEGILDTFHIQLAAAKPSEKKILQFAKIFGSYLGEVFRRNHGARWGMVQMGDKVFPGMIQDAASTEFWPWGRVRNRLVNGSEDNVWHYYVVLCEKAGVSVQSAPTVPAPGRSLWRRITGGS